MKGRTKRRPSGARIVAFIRERAVELGPRESRLIHVPPRLVKGGGILGLTRNGGTKSLRQP